MEEGSNIETICVLHERKWEQTHAEVVVVLHEAEGCVKRASSRVSSRPHTICERTFDECVSFFHANTVTQHIYSDTIPNLYWDEEKREEECGYNKIFRMKNIKNPNPRFDQIFRFLFTPWPIQVIWYMRVNPESFIALPQNGRWKCHRINFILVDIPMTWSYSVKCHTLTFIHINELSCLRFSMSIIANKFANEERRIKAALCEKYVRTFQAYTNA